jgi:iron complex outermembrane receptor protein
MKQISIVIIFLFCAVILHAQETLKGKVIDALTRNPLQGASINSIGKGVAFTNEDGFFSIPCDVNNKLTITFLGYEPVEKFVKNCRDELVIEMVPFSHSMEDVEITTTSAQNKSVLYQPASIAKLNTRELKRGTGLYLDDAINANVPGVAMQRRSVSGGQQFNIRGYGNGVRGTNGVSSNFDNQGSKVYLNGIPLTDAEGITIMDDIDFGSIGNVEVTKGPSGTLSGLAIAGVINLNTVKPDPCMTSMGQEVQVGSYGLKRFTTSFQTANEHSSLLANYGHQESDGFMSHTASTKQFVNLAGNFQLGPKQSLFSYFGYSKSYDQRGGELTIDQYNNRDYSGNPEYIKRNAHSEVTSFRAGLGHSYQFNKNISNTTTVFGTAMNTNASSAGGWTDKDPVNFGLRSVIDTKFPLNNEVVLSGITGVETQHQYAQTMGYTMVADAADPNGYWVVGAMRSNQSTYTGTSSLFTEWTLSLPREISITAGLGWSNMNIELNDRFYVANSTNPRQYKKSYSNMLSPHIAINKVFNKQLSLYASYSKGYKAPVSSYFFIPATGKLNTSLKPEVGDQYEVGSKGLLFHDKLSYQVAVFDALFSNKMTAVAVPLDGSATTTAYSYVANGGKQDNKGIEALLKYTAYESYKGFVKAVKPFANFAYSDFTYKDFKFQKFKAGSNNTAVDTVDYSGKDVAGVPRVTFNIGLDVLTSYGFYGNAYYAYRDAMPITSDGKEMTDSYSLLNAKLGLRRMLSNHFDADLYFGVNNITGTQYYYMVFVNQLPDAYLPAPNKANYFGGINLKYNF